MTESLHKKPRIISKIPILQNSNMLRPQNISGRNVAVKNICAFDTIIQSLLIGYPYWVSYYDYINTHNN